MSISSSKELSPPFCVSSSQRGRDPSFARLQTEGAKGSWFQSGNHASLGSSPIPASARQLPVPSEEWPAPRTHTLRPLFRPGNCAAIIATAFWEGFSAPFSLVSAVDTKVASIANRVAEIVNSWPPPEEHSQEGSIKRQVGTLLFVSEGLNSQPQAANAKKGKLPSESVCGAGCLQTEAREHPHTDSARLWV